MKKDYLVLLIQLDGNLASDVSTRCSDRPLGNYVRLIIKTGQKLPSCPAVCSVNVCILNNNLWLKYCQEYVLVVFYMESWLYM